MAVLAAMATLAAGACGGDDPPSVAVAEPPTAAPATDDDAAAEDAADDTSGDAGGSGPAAGGSGPCATAPAANVDGGYPEANLPAVQVRTDELVAAFDAAEGRFCIDGGDITYFLVYDFPSDGFHSLDVCGSVFSYFEGDFERAGIVYTDDQLLCG